MAAHHLLLVIDPTAAAYLTRVALAVGNRERAAGVVLTAGRLAGASPDLPAVAAAAAHARGLFENDPGALAVAAAQHRQPWARAVALEDLGVVLADRDPTAARLRLEEGLNTYDAMGASFDAARVRALLTQADVSSIGRPVRPAKGWRSLTSTELQVAELVAEGLTNAEVATRIFLSRHTVDFHLRHIFRKLDVTSRVGLTRVVVGRR
jgi:DNA-binding CsgD family transcriptional regulator